MAEKNSVLIRNSRYVSGGETEVGLNTIEHWERAVFPVNKDDTSYVVEKKFVGRLDLITAVFLTEPRYWWVVAQYNNILDPYSEIIEGRVLYIPTLDRVKLLLSGKTGGVPSTREVPLSILPVV
jgi:hypothetical protein